ncbi:unnamed protein product, partial [Prorocentrum cordatum]
PPPPPPPPPPPNHCLGKNFRRDFCRCARGSGSPYRARLGAPFGAPRACGSAVPASQVLEHKADAFGSVHFEAALAGAAGDFGQRLRYSLARWRADGRTGVWAKVPNSAAELIPALLAEGFDWHHAQQGYALLTLWLPEGQSQLPRYGGHQVGVGGLVLSPDRRVLLMKEKVPHFGRKESQWKLPGGLADPGEDLGEAAAREVLEETGVVASPEGVLSIHHRHGFKFGVSDLYFAVQMMAHSETIELDANSAEVMDVTWMPLSEVASSPAVMEFNKNIIALVDRPMLVPHWGKHGSVRAEHFFYKPGTPP